MMIRMFDDNRDIDSFLELYRICFGKPMLRDYFEWKYIKNPFRMNIHPIIVAEENDRLIGARAEVPIRMMIKDTTTNALLGADAMVHPEFRGRRIHVEILRFSQELYRDSQYVFDYSFPNKFSIRNNIRAGRQPIYNRIRHWKVLNAQEAFNRVFHNHILQKTGGLISPLLWYKTRIPTLRNQNVTVREVSDMGILEDVYDRWKKPDKIYTVRDETYLNWRFKSHPEIYYQFLTAYAEEEVKGYFVISMTESMGLKIGTIVDYIVVDDDWTVFEPLLNYALNLFKDNNCALADTWVFTQEWAQQVVEDYGFVSSRHIILRHWFPNTYVVARPSDEQNFPCDLTSIEWYITPSDGDAN